MSNPLDRARLLLELCRPSLGEEEARSAVERDPEDCRARTVLAACLAGSGRLDEALAEAGRAAGLAPDRPEAHVTLAAVLGLKDRLREAQAAASRALRLDPGDADVRALLAVIAFLRNRFRQGLEHARCGLELDPQNRTCRLCCAAALFMLDRKEEIGPVSESMLAADPEDEFARALLGWHLVETGRVEKALEHFREALRVEPDDELARQGLLVALKARSRLYRPVLRVMMKNDRRKTRHALLIIVAVTAAAYGLAELAERVPAAWYVFWVLVGLSVLAGLVMTAADPLFNLAMRFHPLGKTVLSGRQKADSILVAAFLAAFLAALAWTLASRRLSAFLVCGVSLTLLFPASTIMDFDSRWARRICGGLLGLLGLLGYAAAGISLAVDRSLAMTLAGYYLDGWLAMIVVVIGLKLFLGA